MSNTQITARVTDQTIQLVNVPVLASGSVGVLQIKCEFDQLWDGYGKTAVFYVKEDEVYHVQVALGVATVPHEVLAAKGPFYFGIVGTAENTRTTEVVRLELRQGALTMASAETEEPTPDVYQQLLAALGKVEQGIAVEKARLDEVIALRGTGSTAANLSAEYVTGTLKSNGYSAYIEITISSLSLIAGGQHYTDYCLAPAQAPIGPVMMSTSNPDINVTIEEPAQDGWARILIENPSSQDYESSSITTAWAYYPLANPGNNEVADIRVGADGKTYASAGTATREQLKQTVKSVNGVKPDAKGEVLIDLTKSIEVVSAGAVFDQANWKYIYANSTSSLFGKAYADSAWRHTEEYVDCAGAKQLNILINNLDSTNSGRGLVFYDADKTAILGHVFPTAEEGTVDMTYDVPENAAYFRTCIKAVYIESFYADLVYEKNASPTAASEANLADKKVLIIGDSISTDSNSTGINYGNYEKWVMKLIKQGFFSADKVTNDSIHATGFLASLSGDGTDCFLPRLQAVQNPEVYDIVIIFGGINDFIKAKPYADFTAAVDAFFEYLTNTFVNSRICILRPLRTSSTSGVGNYNQMDYSAYIGTVAKFYCLPVLNLTEESGFYPWIRDFKNRWTFTGWTGGDGATGDGVHPNEEWEETRLAPMIRAFLLGLIK